MRFLLLVPFLIACKGGESDDQDTGSAPSGIARIQVLPSAMLLTESGASQTVTVVAFDGEDEVMEGLAFTLSSEDPDISVSGNTVTAVSDVGSAQVRVEVEGISQSLFVLMAEPVAGAVLVPDSAVKGIEIVDEGPWQPGSRYKVTLEGVDVAVDDIVVGTQSAPLMGRVTEVDGEEVTLAVVLPEEAFEQLEIHEEWTGDELEVVLQDGVEQIYDVERLDDGTVLLTPKERQPMGLWEDLVECKFSGNVASVNIGQVTLAKDVSGLAMVFDYSEENGFEKLLLTGAVEFSFEAKIEVASQFEGKLNCEARLFTILIPLDGATSAIFGFDVDLGLGGQIDGKAVIANASIKFSAKQKIQAMLGVDCTGEACEWRNEWNYEPDYGTSMDAPDIVEDFSFEAELQFYEFAELVVRPRILHFLPLPAKMKKELEDKLTIKLVKEKTGLSEKWKLAPVLNQAENPNYASTEVFSYFLSFSVPFFADLCTPEDILCTVMGVELPKLEFKETWQLASSPVGSWTEPAFELDSTTIVEGEPITATVRLSPESVEWGLHQGNFTYNVEEVVIYAYDADELTMTERARIPASEGQEVFEWEWTPTAEDAKNPPVLTAFVNPGWPPFGELEIKKDSRLTNGCVPSYLGRIVLRNNEGITVVGPGGSVNDSEEVSFIGDLGNGETVVILDAGGGLTLPAFTGNGRTYGGGAPINASGQTTVRERVSNKYLTRIWNLDETGITTGRSWDGDFDSAQFWQDINSSGQVALVGLTDDSENVSLFKWTGSQLQTIGVYDGYTSVRPQISDSGRVVYRGDNDQLLVNDGNGSTTIHSGPVSRHPGISATGDRLAWITTGSIESLNFAFEKNGNYETFVLSTTPNGFSNLDEENRQGVAHIPGVCDAGASVVVFLATKNGIEGVHVATLNDSADTGVPSLAGIQTLVESGDVIDGETLGDFSLFDPVSPNGTIVVKSGSDTFILFSPEWPR